MKIKLTDSGKVSMKLDIFQRNDIYVALCDYLDRNPSYFGALSKEADIMRALHYCTINEMALKNDFHLQTSEDKKVTLSRSQAIALMWLLRLCDDRNTLLEIKSQLHKLLL